MRGHWLLGLVALFGAGCSGGGSSDGVKSDVQQSLSTLDDLAKKTNGNFDQLSPADKATVVKSFGGDETAARTRFPLIAHPPNQAKLAENKAKGR